MTAAAQEISVRPQLKSGDEFRLEITRVREDSSRPARNGRSVGFVDVKVLTAGPGGFEVLWIPRENENQAAAATLPDGLGVAAVKALSGLEFRLKLTADGEYVGLANENEVVARMQKATDIIIRGAIEKVAEAQRATIQKVLAEVLSPTTLVATATRDAQTYLGLNGLALAVGKPHSVDLEQPNPFGGPGLPAKFRVVVESATNDAAVLTTTTVYDSAGLVNMTKGLAERAGTPVSPAELAGVTVQMTDEGRFVLDRQFGLMREIVVSRSITSGSAKRLDRSEIKLVRAPQR